MFGHMLGGIHGVSLIIGLVVVVAVFLLYRHFRKQRAPHSIQDQLDSLEILKIRLASGEINPEEYNKLKSVLQEKNEKVQDSPRGRFVRPGLVSDSGLAV